MDFYVLRSYLDKLGQPLFDSLVLAFQGEALRPRSLG